MSPDTVVPRSHRVRAADAVNDREAPFGTHPQPSCRPWVTTDPHATWHVIVWAGTDQTGLEPCSSWQSALATWRIRDDVNMTTPTATFPLRRGSVLPDSGRGQAVTLQSHHWKLPCFLLSVAVCIRLLAVVGAHRQQ